MITTHPGFWKPPILHSLDPKGQVQLPSNLPVYSINLKSRSSAWQPCPPLLTRPHGCLCAEDTSPFSKSFCIQKHLMPSDFFFFPFLSLSKKYKATNPAVLAVEKNFTIEVKTNHNHGQHHISQKTVYVCPPYRTYFKVTK